MNPSQEIYATLEPVDDGYILVLEKDNGLQLTIPTNASDIIEYTDDKGYSFGWKHGMVVWDEARGSWPAQLLDAGEFIETYMGAEDVEAFAKQFTQYEAFAKMEAPVIELKEAAKAA